MNKKEIMWKHLRSSVFFLILYLVFILHNEKQTLICLLGKYEQSELNEGYNYSKYITI